MTDYKCGHSQKILILDDNPLSIIAYLEWVNSVGREGTKEFCFGCWSKKLTCKLCKGKKFIVLQKSWRINDIEKYPCPICQHVVESPVNGKQSAVERTDK
jgi:hypothetical protein